MNTRLDTFLVEQKGIASREKAKQLILDGKVVINGVAAKKASQKVKENDEVKMEDTYIYVSRSAHKLLAAIENWDIKAEGKTCLDIGSSTGGFTEVLLQDNAKKVYAVDVGVDQLHESVENDDRVVSMEGKDIRNLTSEDIKESIEIIVIDVSFISITHIIPLLKKFGEKGMEVVTLLKPQFEVGKKYLKKGIVKDEQRVEEVKELIAKLFIDEGFDVQPSKKSPVKGKEGNQEYLLYAVKK
jgi:23S rRNA (cytidine1920-2'-O)/16S rRNA (cytidine1409-2'-O)-methyltransferase